MRDNTESTQEKPKEPKDLSQSSLETQEKSLESKPLAHSEGRKRRIQGMEEENVAGIQTTSPEAMQKPTRPGESLPHLNGGSVLEELDVQVDEMHARKISKHEYHQKEIGNLADKNLKGVVYEGMTQRALEDQYGAAQVEAHPQNMHLKDGSPIEPDFAVRDEKGNIVELVDAKAYTRKDTKNPEAAASSLTHTGNLEKASRYKEADLPGLKQVTFAMPEETAHMSAVQERVAQMGNETVPVNIAAVGSEDQIKQRMEDLRKPAGEQFVPARQTFEEIQRIQSLPVEQRRDAVAQLVESLKDKKHDPTAELRNLGWHTRIERNGAGITFMDPHQAGKEYTIWYE